MEIRQAVLRMKEETPKMASSAAGIRNAALENMREALLNHKNEIFSENEKDLAMAKEQGIPAQIRKRLAFGESKLTDVTAGLEQLISLPDPVGRVQLKRELDRNLILTRVTVPIGVIGVIFEARPDALVQISGLCIKSGNCAVLKGGKEAARTNRILFSVIREAAEKAGLPDGCLYQAEGHSEIDELLSCDDCVDLLIPRGSNKFVRYIMEHTRIPVMGHADGVCHIYVDRDADFDKALRVIIDAKTQYPAACNSVETILIDRSCSGFLTRLKKSFDEAGVQMIGTKEVSDLTGCMQMEDEEQFHHEYGDLKASVALVDGVEGAADHINRYGSHHTDCILTENDAAAAYFMRMVDSAGVYRNCSTRFADGFRYGFGAEVGISTGKLHARGPVGLEGLVTYKYMLEGDGQIVGDYASGKCSFHHRDIVNRI